MYKIIYFSFALIFLPKLCQGQSGCHALFGFQQAGTTLTVNFMDLTTSSTPITSWLWDFGDGHSSGNNNPDHTYAHAGTYEVCLTVHNNHGCTSTYCHSVTVSAIQTGCHALFGFQQAGTTLTINFADSTSSSTPITSWLWDFGDGHSSTSNNPHHTYAHAGTYEVCLTVHNNHGCTSTYCHSVTVTNTNHNCLPSFTTHLDSKRNKIYFLNTSSNISGHTQYLWTFGDGHSSSEKNPNHTYSHTGVYSVCLTIIDDNTGCNSHICRDVEINHLWQSMAVRNEFSVSSRNVENEMTYGYGNEFISFPNPFSTNTTISYELESDTYLKIELHDLSGRMIRQLYNGSQTKGTHSFVMSRDYLIANVYVLKMIYNGKIFSKKLLVVE